MSLAKKIKEIKKLQNQIDSKKYPSIIIVNTPEELEGKAGTIGPKTVVIIDDITFNQNLHEPYGHEAHDKRWETEEEGKN